MLHPAVGRALATAHIEDLHRGAAIRVDSATWTAPAHADGMTPSEIPRPGGIRSSVT